MLGWVQYGFLKERIDTHYKELVFLHLVASMGHIVHFSASEALTHYFSSWRGPGVVSIKSTPGYTMPNLHFCIQLDLWVTLCILVHPGMKRRRTIFHAQVVPVWI
jgi:hypothetical protein